MNAQTVGLGVLTRFFLAKGRGSASHELTAFDRALLDAGVGDVNLVRLSSILPPGCMQIAPLQLQYGSLIPVAYTAMTSSEPNARIASAVAIGIPADCSQAGLIMEYSACGSAAEVEAIVRSMVDENMGFRSRPIANILSISVEQVVQRISCTFAGVIMLP